MGCLWLTVLERSVCNEEQTKQAQLKVTRFKTEAGELDRGNEDIEIVNSGDEQQSRLDLDVTSEVEPLKLLLLGRQIN